MIEYKVTLGSIGVVFSTLAKLLQDTGKTYRLTIKEWRETRSLSQNALMWKWLTEINEQAPLQCDANVSGSEMWHNVFKHYYCPKKVITNGKVNMSVKSTKMLDVGEMTHYLYKIELWCIERGIKLTIPQDSEYYKLMEQQNA